MVIGCGTSAPKGSTPTAPAVEPAPTAPAAVADDASDLIEEAFRDHRQRYGEPAAFDPQQPLPIDDIGVR